jgi:abnormal spindle-like microcephaly-associated protein
MFNIKVALDALASNKEGKQLFNNIRAEDIVNGHREKTIALLWGLVSKWGLSGLVNLGDLETEIMQLKQRAISLGHDLETHDDKTNEHSENGEAAVLLKQWALLVTQLHGLQPNVTTNLGDGKVYECILDEYEGYILSQNQFDLSNGCKASLEDRLRALGCSTQFSESPNHPQTKSRL